MLNVVLPELHHIIVLGLLTAAILVRSSGPFPAVLSNLLPVGAAGALVLVLLADWSAAVSHPNAIGGLLPWNDAMGYFSCARQTLDGGGLGSFCQRRPLYTLMLAGLLGLGGRDLQTTLLLQAIVVGLACGLLARQVDKSFNRAKALVALAALVLFASQFVTTTLTENGGLLIGALATCFLWSGANNRRHIDLAAGAFLLTIALSARAGAFFTLPALILWAVLAQPRDSPRRVITPAILSAAILAAFLVSPAITLMAGGDTQNNHLNFAQVLYGLSVGGKGWLRIYTDHPEIFANSANTKVDIGRAIYAVSIDNIVHRPHWFAWGYTRGLAKFPQEFYRFDGFWPVRVLFLGLWITGIAAAIRWRSDRRYMLLGLLAAGVFFSSPFITFDAGARGFAATIPIDVLLVVAGLHAVTKLRVAARWRPSTGQTNGAKWPGPEAALVVTFSAMALAGLLLTPALPVVEATGCSTDEQSLALRLDKESPTLRLAAAVSGLFPLTVTDGGFRRNLNKFVHRRQMFQMVEPEAAFTWAYDRRAGHRGEAYLVLWRGGLPPANAFVAVCGQMLADPPFEGFLEVKSWDIMPEPRVRFAREDLSLL